MYACLYEILIKISVAFQSRKDLVFYVIRVIRMKKLMMILLCLIFSWSAEPMMKSMGSVLWSSVLEKKQEKVPAHVGQTQPPKVETASVVLPPTGGPTTINITLNMNQNASGNNCIETNSQSQANAESIASATSQSQATVDVEVLQSMWNAYQEPMQTWWNGNKIYFGACALLTLYSYYCYQVICGNLYLKRTDVWSSWKHELSFDQLCQIPQQSLARELVLSIQHHGLDMQKPTDFMSPLVLFLQVIEQERITLLYYQTLYNRITTVKCSIIFPFNKKRYNRIEERLQRLSFVKNIFISWMAEFNIEHAKSVLL